MEWFFVEHSSFGLFEQKLIIVLVRYDANITMLLENHLRTFPDIHETGASIDSVTEVIQQMMQTAWEASFDIGYRKVVPPMDGPFGHAQL